MDYSLELVFCQYSVIIFICIHLRIRYCRSSVVTFTYYNNMKDIVIAGIAGSGKGTQARALREHL